MRLLSVRVSNFRAIRQMNLQLESQVTVIVGRNGAGKTTLLEAISKSLKQQNVLAGLIRKNEILSS